MPILVHSLVPSSFVQTMVFVEDRSSMPGNCVGLYNRSKIWNMESYLQCSDWRIRAPHRCRDIPPYRNADCTITPHRSSRVFSVLPGLRSTCSSPIRKCTHRVYSLDTTPTWSGTDLTQFGAQSLSCFGELRLLLAFCVKRGNTVASEEGARCVNRSEYGALLFRAQRVCWFCSEADVLQDSGAVSESDTRAATTLLFSVSKAGDG